MTTTEQTITPEQTAEWQALHDRMAELAAAKDEAERAAGSWLAWGLSRNEGEYAHRKALEEAQKAIDLWAERALLNEQVDAHPYQAVVMARAQAWREARS